MSTKKVQTPVCSEVGRWTPIRDGDRYCSPRCGHGCTWAAYQHAVESANALCVELGEGWKPRVWENSGWYFSATRGKTEVHYNKGQGFSVYFNSDAKQYLADGPDAREAVRAAMNEAMADIDQLRREVMTSGLVDVTPREISAK